MKKLGQLLLVLFVGGVVLSGCGQSGSLTLTQKQQDEVDAAKEAEKAERAEKIKAAKAAKCAEAAAEAAELIEAEEAGETEEAVECVEVTEGIGESIEGNEEVEDNAAAVEEAMDEQPVVTE